LSGIDVVDRVLNYLEDGEWRKLYDIQKKLGIRLSSTLFAVQFLEQYGFIEVKKDDTTKFLMVRVIPQFKEFVERVK